MKFYSTRNRNLKVDLKQAITKSLSEDGGLYLPEQIPQLPADFFEKLPTLTLAEIGFEVSRLILDEIPEADLKRICDDALSFETPLVKVDDDCYSLELFHGPTMAFKDVGARFMARLLSYLLDDKEEEVHVLVATSGDTGSAVASGFHNVPGIRVTILYPSGGVSPFQEKQLTTLGGNIIALEVDGVFDDCQRLVKQAFADEQLKKERRLTSANSINFGRLLPQSFYYHYAVGQLMNSSKPIVISVPSGNYGNLTAGVIAWKMGLPIQKFVASSNANNVVPRYLESGNYEPKASVQTISNAMDVGNPNNVERLQDLFNHDLDALREMVKGYSFSDEETMNTMISTWEKQQYVLDPHGAVALSGLQKYKAEIENNVEGIFLECAHPAKFDVPVFKATGVYPEIPEHQKEVLHKPKRAMMISSNFDEFKDWLLHDEGCSC
ncbi:threonine synthase [bacterium]|nr:MAG: threonine synthase [bacterium]